MEIVEFGVVEAMSLRDRKILEIVIQTVLHCFTMRIHSKRCIVR